jgi:hypothetical protein
MLKFGLGCLAACGIVILVGIALDHSRILVSGPCAGPGIIALYLLLLLSGGLGTIFTAAGLVAALVRRMLLSR